MEKLKKILFLFLKKISRIIYWIIPIELKPNLDLTDKIVDYTKNKSFEVFKEDLKKSVLFNDYEKIRKYSIETALQNDQNLEKNYLEFGVFTGTSANFFSKFVKKLYVFDSFEGLKDDWGGVINHPKGYYDLKKKLPKLNANVEPVVGWVEDTLEEFLKKNNKEINFVHIDLDTYESTLFVLKKIKPLLSKNAIIIFDELYNYFGFEYGEYKALKEAFNDNEYIYKAFMINGPKVVVQIK